MRLFQADDLYTFIKKIELSNGDGNKALLINNFCRPDEIKTLVFDHAETQRLFNDAGQGTFKAQLLTYNLLNENYFSINF